MQRMNESHGILNRLTQSSTHRNSMFQESKNREGDQRDNKNTGHRWVERWCSRRSRRRSLIVRRDSGSGRKDRHRENEHEGLHDAILRHWWMMKMNQLQSSEESRKHRLRNRTLTVWPGFVNKESINRGF